MVGPAVTCIFLERTNIKTKFYNKILGKLHEAMQFSMYAVNALRTFKITKIFLTAILSPDKLKMPVNTYVFLLPLNLRNFRMKCSERVSVTIICI